MSLYLNKKFIHEWVVRVEKLDINSVGFLEGSALDFFTSPFHVESLQAGAIAGGEINLGL